jgi:hypothetical protein
VSHEDQPDDEGGRTVTAGPTLLKVLLTRQHWQKFETFCAEYERTAAEVGRELRGTAPSKAQYYRWLSGQLKGGVPYPDACRVLERMFPDWTAAELFGDCPAEVGDPAGVEVSPSTPAGQLADVAAVYTSRAEFSAKLPTAALLDGARDVRAAGLSLNMLTQHYPDASMRRLIEDGMSLRCLFLDPRGDAIRAREREERHPPGALVGLTELNMAMLADRVGQRLSPAAGERLQIRVYDETIRFNILLVDRRVGVVQPYMPESRGTDSPTLVLEPERDSTGLFPVFEQVFDSLWERSKPR